MTRSWNSARKTFVFISVAAGLAGTVALPALGQPVLTPVNRPSLVKQSEPPSTQVPTTVMCPPSAHVVHDSASQGGWAVLIGGFNMPLWSVAVQNNNASTDYLRCNYGGLGQFALVKTVKKGSCTVMGTTGFVCK